MHTDPRINTGACRTAVYMITRKPPRTVYRPVVKANTSAITQNTSTRSPKMSTESMPSNVRTTTSPA